MNATTLNGTAATTTMVATSEFVTLLATTREWLEHTLPPLVRTLLDESTSTYQRASEFLTANIVLLCALPLLAATYVMYYLSFHVRRPHLTYQLTPLNQAIIARLPRLHRKYWPTWYLTHEIAQAAVGSFVRLDPHIKRSRGFEREILHMASDGEAIALDWLAPHVDCPPDAPIVFTCHGLAGHTDELNMQYLARLTQLAGCRFAIFNRRGCALDMKLTKEALYLWGCTRDMREILAHVKRRYPHAPIIGVGYSAGSNLLTKYLGETGAESLLDAGISVANSYDVKRTSEYLARKPFHSFVMVNILKNLLARNEEIFTQLEKRLEKEVREADSSDAHVATSTRRRPLSLARVRKVKNVLEWDEHFSLLTHTQYGDNLDAFYAAQSTTPEMIANIAVPLLNLHSLDDPIIPDEIIPYQALHANPNVMIARTIRGGHLGYTEGIFPFNKATWMEALTVEYVKVLTQPDIWAKIVELRTKSREAAAAADEKEVDAVAKPSLTEQPMQVNISRAASRTYSIGQQQQPLGDGSQDTVDTQAPTRQHSGASHASAQQPPQRIGSSLSRTHSTHSQPPIHLTTLASLAAVDVAPLRVPSFASFATSFDGDASLQPQESPLAEDESRLPATPDSIVCRDLVEQQRAEEAEDNAAITADASSAPMETDVDGATVAFGADAHSHGSLATTMEFELTPYLAATDSAAAAPMRVGSKTLSDARSPTPVLPLVAADPQPLAERTPLTSPKRRKVATSDVKDETEEAASYVEGAPTEEAADAIVESKQDQPMANEDGASEDEQKDQPVASQTPLKRKL